MMRATQLRGRAVIDMDAAEKLGRVDRIFLDTQARKVAGFRVSHGGMLTLSLNPVMIPASSVHAIGPDAITVHCTAVEDATRLVEFPRVFDFVGRTVISQRGQKLGVIDDVLISEADGRIIGYELADGNVMAQLGRLIADTKKRQIRYIRADADVRTGRDLMIVPEEAVANWELAESPAPPALATASDSFEPAGSTFRSNLVESTPGPR
jgi:uncharacterized protein YrrD